jgi:hypothetical protein
MTATLNRTERDHPFVEDITAEPEPERQTFTVGTLTIEAVDEEDALRQYKRLVRAEALKAKAEMSWCDSGTNDRLDNLGLRRVGQGVPMRVTVTATRTAWLAIDADDVDEAIEVIGDGVNEPIIRLANSMLGGRGWTVNRVAADPLQRHDGDYAVGDEDRTVMAERAAGHTESASCGKYHSGYYCTRQPDHEHNHAAGDSRTIMAVWPNRE